MFPFFEKKYAMLQACEGHAMNFPLHLHVCPEFIYLEKGNMTLWIGERKYSLQDGDFAIIFPNRVHGYETISSPHDTRFLMAICQPEMAGSLADSLLGSHPSHPVIEGDRLHADIPYAMASLHTAAREGADAAVVKAFVQLILARTLTMTGLVKNKKNHESSLVVRAVTYVSEHYLEPLTLDLLSRELGVCRYTLSRTFSEDVRIGFPRYINQMRVSYAKNLLENSRQSVLSVGLDSGFENQRTFNRVFKDLCGVTPLQYRKRGSSR